MFGTWARPNSPSRVAHTGTSSLVLALPVVPSSEPRRPSSGPEVPQGGEANRARAPTCRRGGRHFLARTRRVLVVFWAVIAGLGMTLVLISDDGSTLPVIEDPSID